MNQTKMIALLALLALVSLAACGDTGEQQETPAETSLAATNYCEAFFEPLCERQIGCNVALVNQATSVQTCIEEAGRLCDPELVTWLESLDAGHTVYNQDNMSACREAITGAQCKLLATGFVPEICQDVFEGNAQQGQECFTEVECQEGLICASAGRCPGLCEEPNGLPDDAFDCGVAGCLDGFFCDGSVCREVLSEGEGCPNDDDACEGDLFCGRDVDDPRLLCRAPKAQGEACFTRSGCQSGLSCQIVTTQTNERTCEPARTEEGECFDKEECAEGLVCERNAGRCVSPRVEGETCFEASDCGEGLYCWFEFTPEDLQTGVCREDRKVGVGQDEPCNPLVDRCRLGLFCRAGDNIGLGQCEVLPDVGEACADFTRNLNEECRTGSCVFVDGAPVCIEKGDAGAPCGSGEECLSTSCVDGACAAFEDVYCTVSGAQ